MYKLVKLGKIARISTGFPFKGEQYSTEGVRVVRGENVTEGSLRWDSVKCWNEEFDQADKYSLKDGDVVIGMDGSKVGKNRARIKKNDLPLLLAQRVALIRNNELSNQNFLYYLIKAKRFEEYVERIQTGSSVPHISQQQIAEYLVPFIPIDVQKKISDLLLSLDSKISLNNRINAELEAMAKTIYDYWFVQFDFPSPSSLGRAGVGSPYKSSGGKMVWSEELKREIPEGWIVGTVNDLGEIIGGSTPSTEEEENFENDGTPWITPKDLSLNVGNKFITKGEVSVSKRGIEKASLKVMPEGTILLSSRAPIGYMAISREPVTTNQGFKNIVPNKGYSTEIAYYLIKNLIPVIEKNSSGSTFKEISGSVLKSIKVLLPNKNQATSLTEILSPIFKKQNLLELENQKLTELRDWLLPMLMNGQIKIKDAEQELAMAAEPEVSYRKTK